MKIIVLSSHTQSLFWFRMDMMRDFQNKDIEVIAIGNEPEIDWSHKFSEQGILYKSVYVKRNGLSPIADLRTILELIKIFKEIRPDKIFSYQAKTIIYGSVAARLVGIKEYYSLIAGLGSVFRGQSTKTNIIKVLMKLQYKIACLFSEKVIFQNQDDKKEFISNGLVRETKIEIINGSGVDVNKFAKAPLPSETSFLFIGRLIKDKGVVEYLEACKNIKLKYPNSRCLLVGPYDTNPSALKENELSPYINEGIIEYYGEQMNVIPFIKEASVFVLPSYHEGTPKTVLESMSMGRAIITTDAPGCRETVINNSNGFLVEVRNKEDLYKKMERLILKPTLIKDMGEKSREIAIMKYDVKLVNKRIMEIMKII